MNWTCTATAQLGVAMCQRTGVGKVRHLELKAILVDSRTAEVESVSFEQRDD